MQTAIEYLDKTESAMRKKLFKTLCENRDRGLDYPRQKLIAIRLTPMRKLQMN